MSDETKAPTVGSYVRDELKARGWTTLDAANQLEGNHETNEAWLKLICQDMVWVWYDVAFGDHEAKMLEVIFGVEAQTWLDINERFVEGNKVSDERKWNPVRSQTCGHLRAAHNYQSNPEDEWTDEDITLIASSPDLLAALEELVDFASLDHKHTERSAMAFTAARLAIAKAKGEV